MWHVLLSVALASDNPAPPAAGPEAPPAELVPLQVDCKVPAEILVDKVKLAQLHFPGKVEFPITAGHHDVRVYVAGNPTDLPIDARPGTTVQVLAGRTGVTAETVQSAPAATTDLVELSVRVVGVPAVQIRLDDERRTIQAGPDTVLKLPAGSHRLSVRSADGTAIWSTGILEVHGQAVLQLSEGRLPELSGGATFHAGA